MKKWAWVWLITFALIGWAPALLVLWMTAYPLAVGLGWGGLPALGFMYTLILMVGLVLLIQVQRYFVLTDEQALWYSWGGGAGIVAIWAGAFLSFTLRMGII